MHHISYRDQYGQQPRFRESITVRLLVYQPLSRNQTFCIKELLFGLAVANYPSKFLISDILNRMRSGGSLGQSVSYLCFDTLILTKCPYLHDHVRIGIVHQIEELPPSLLLDGEMRKM